MKIAIDARIASYTDAGISRYCWGLLGGLEAVTTEFEICVLSSRKKRLGFSSGSQRSELSLVTPPHSPFEKFFFTTELRVRDVKLDLVHAMDFYAPLSSSFPQILSVYDLYFLHEPAVLDRFSFRHYKKVLRYAEMAKHVICSSEATKRDFLEFANCDEQKVSVVYPGFSPLGAKPKDGKRNTLPSSVSGSYILFVGTLEPRKNLIRLLKAYCLAFERLGSEMPRLILAGSRGFRAEEVFVEVASLGLLEKVTYLGRVSDEDLCSLYRQAEFVVYPSLYEGFGFPLLEALSAGKAILSSRISSIPEVVGDAALLVHPLSVEEIRDGLIRLVDDVNYRQALGEKGKEVLQAYSWQKAARETLQVYRQVLGL